MNIATIDKRHEASTYGVGNNAISMTQTIKTPGKTRSLHNLSAKSLARQVVLSENMKLIYKYYKKSPIC